MSMLSALPAWHGAGWSVAWVAILLAASSCVVGCGDPVDSPAEQRARAAVEDFQHAFAEGNFEKACNLMTKSAHRFLGVGGHAVVQPCYHELRSLAIGIDRRLGDDGRQPPAITDVDLAGARATVTLRLEGGPPSHLPLVKEGSQWKLDAVYGDLPADRQPLNRL
jgi:hypothetical protein